ncbi:hypothetical protein HEK616_79950 (plasmid) [Streptomyces nigrescens]|uniref:DUF998 domain-containing protein n=1 Tax=Streptomyces nigrescens TaxID=1920 RepID=A0ABM8A778_STRNI|nr:DUF998 domain-containing protein [Streptomyces nigrescens]BDM74508.1 hypothetical protein HEK616_79950 [Streptomyces nigrescens]
MTQAIDAPFAHRAVSTPLATRALLVAGAAAGPLFLGVGVIEGLTRNGFDFTRNAISQLSLGSPGWIQVVSFLLTGVLITAGAVGIRRAIGHTAGGTWAPRLIGVFGASFLLAGVFTADPGAGFPVGTPDGPATLSAHGSVHMLSGMVGYLALCAALLVLARHFAAHARRGWARTCRIVPVGILAGFAGSATTVAAFTVGAGLGLLMLTAVIARLAGLTSTSER